jgi:hypothetical protein
MRFSQDEYDILSGGELVNITFPDDNLSVYNQMENTQLPPSSDIFYDQIEIILEKSRNKWETLVKWVGVTFNDMLDDIAITPPNPYIPYIYKLKYGTTRGLYDVKETGRGVSALVAASAKYALYQFDPKNVEVCEFVSNGGAGKSFGS